VEDYGVTSRRSTATGSICATEVGMTPEELKALARRGLERVWSADGGVDPAAVYAADFVSHQHGHPTVDDIVGLDALATFIGSLPAR
jgi:hypothetical protein